MKKKKKLFSGEWVSADFLLHRQLYCTVVIHPRENSRVRWHVNWSRAISLASEKFLWLSSSIKGFIGVKPARFHQNIHLSLSPWMQKAQPGCLCCVPQSTTGKWPTGQWTEPTITPPHLDSACLVISADLHFAVFSFNRISSGGEKKSKIFLVSQVLVSCSWACYSTVILTLSPGLAPDTIAAVAELSPPSPWHPTWHAAFALSFSEQRDFPSPAHVCGGAQVLSEQFMHYF